MKGTWQGHCWDIIGTLLGHYGKLLAHDWDIMGHYGTLLGHYGTSWDINGTWLAHYWNTMGHSGTLLWYYGTFWDISGIMWVNAQKHPFYWGKSEKVWFVTISMAIFPREYCNSAKSTSQNPHGRDRNFWHVHFYPQKVDISFEPKSKMSKNPRRDEGTPHPRRRLPDVFGTTCGTPLRTLLEPFSVPLLGKKGV